MAFELNFARGVQIGLEGGVAVKAIWEVGKPLERYQAAADQFIRHGDDFLWNWRRYHFREAYSLLPESTLVELHDKLRIKAIEAFQDKNPLRLATVFLSGGGPENVRTYLGFGKTISIPVPPVAGGISIDTVLLKRVQGVPTTVLDATHGYRFPTFTMIAEHLKKAYKDWAEDRIRMLAPDFENRYGPMATWKSLPREFVDQARKTIGIKEFAHALVKDSQLSHVFSRFHGNVDAMLHALQSVRGGADKLYIPLDLDEIGDVSPGTLQEEAQNGGTVLKGKGDVKLKNGSRAGFFLEGQGLEIQAKRDPSFFRFLDALYEKFGSSSFRKAFLWGAGGLFSVADIGVTVSTGKSTPEHFLGWWGVPGFGAQLTSYIGSAALFSTTGPFLARFGLSALAPALGPFLAGANVFLSPDYPTDAFHFRREFLKEAGDRLATQLPEDPEGLKKWWHQNRYRLAVTEDEKLGSEYMEAFRNRLELEARHEFLIQNYLGPGSIGYPLNPELAWKKIEEELKEKGHAKKVSAAEQRMSHSGLLLHGKARKFSPSDLAEVKDLVSLLKNTPPENWGAVLALHDERPTLVLEKAIYEMIRPYFEPSKRDETTVGSANVVVSPKS